MCHQVKVDVRLQGTNFDLRNCSIQRQVTCLHENSLKNISFHIESTCSKPELAANCPISYKKYYYDPQTIDFIENGTILKCGEGNCQHYNLAYDCIITTDMLTEYTEEGDWGKCGCRNHTDSNDTIEFVHGETCPKGNMSCPKVC